MSYVLSRIIPYRTRTSSSSNKTNVHWSLTRNFWENRVYGRWWQKHQNRNQCLCSIRIIIIVISKNLLRRHKSISLTKASQQRIFVVYRNSSTREQKQNVTFQPAIKAWLLESPTRFFSDARNDLFWLIYIDKAFFISDVVPVVSELIVVARAILGKRPTKKSSTRLLWHLGRS